MSDPAQRSPRPPGARRPSTPPRWFGAREPWRPPAGPAPARRRLSVRRHALPIVAAALVGSGIVLLWPGDLRLVSTPRSGVAAEASPAAGSASGQPAASVLEGAPTGQPAPTAVSGASDGATTSSDPNATPTAASTEPAAPSGPTAASPDPSAASSPDPSAAVSPTAPPILTSIADLPDDPARRRAQTWDAPTDPSLLDGYRWPLPKGQITDPFGPSPWGSRVVDGQLFHDGLDIATFCGDRIVAAHDGLVLAAGRTFDEKIGWVGDLGPYEARLDAQHLWWTLPITVVIDDGNGYRSIYAHFYQVVVKPGQRVKAGQFLGYEGATGRATGCHLHYGLFAPHETATFAIEPAVVKRMLVPAAQIARIDPLLVLPHRPGDEEPTRLTDPNTGHGIEE